MYDIFIEPRLPKTLKKEELFEYIRQAKEGNLEAREKVITHNLRLVSNQVVKKFTNVPYEKEELFSIGTIGLIKAVDTFDISKDVSFATYAISCINNEILQFMRKAKRYLKEESLEQSVFLDKDGNALKTEDTLRDDIDIVEEYMDNETYQIIRKLVNELPERDRDIVIMHFGFFGNKIYGQKEIATKYNISQSGVSRRINKIVKELGSKLELQGLIELREEKEYIVSRKIKTIYEYFNQYTREQIDEMLKKLTEKEKLLITLRYGQDLDHPNTNEKWDEENEKRFYGCLVPKMRKLLSSQNNEKNPITKKVVQSNAQKETILTPCITELEVRNVIVDEEKETLSKEPQKSSLLSNDSITKEEYVKILELLRTTTFTQMMELLSLKDAIIISLKLGYVDGKCFSTKSIANFLEIEEDEVREITKKALLLYKDNINELIDNAIKVATDQSMVLSLK